ncbi:glycosyltransferase family 2 protein [Geomonas agri]|uniref:glycosyltransferase family 2 protein n=1 Tax=Geomonas agri TaxID=2873702 RepID=UPI001CD714B8|nr:glycosyltransferase family 2 protein [Geomonas agri]
MEHLLVNRVYVVVVNWNGWRDTLECLESLRALSYSPLSVIVCDNGSTDDSLHRLRDWVDDHDIDCAEYSAAEAECGGIAGLDPWLVLVRNGANLGFAGGNNVALRYALSRDDFSYAWLLNNDTVVDPDALAHLVRRMEEQPSIGMCGSTIRYYEDRDKVQALGGGHYCRFVGLPWHYGRFWGGRTERGRAERWMNYVEGASLMVSRRFLKEVGLMSEDYFLYFEEADWAERAKGRFELGFAPRSLVYHKVGRSIGTSSNPRRKSYTCDFYNVRNRILFTRRYYPYALPTVYLVLVGGLLLRILLGRFDHAAMVLRLILGRAKR